MLREKLAMVARTDVTPASPGGLGKRLFIGLFSGSLIVWTVGNGLLPLLPVYAGQLGADPSSIGYFLSFTYLALAAGTLAAGWLSDKLQRRKVSLVIATAASAPAAWMIGQANNIWSLALFSATVFFLGGVGLTMTSIFAGLYAREVERGKMFGILALTSALGALIGGSTFGVLADDLGFSGLFTAVALILASWPLTGLLLQERTVPPRHPREKSSNRLSLRGSLPLFLIASTLGNIVLYEGRLGTSLTMRGFGFSSAAIASTAAVGGAVGLILSPALGTLSDKFGRKRPLVTCFFLAAIGVAVLAAVSGLWKFWAASALLSVFSYTGTGLGSALITDLVERASLGRGLSLFTATIWVGGVVGLAETGLSLRSLGTATTFSLGAGIMLVAAVLVLTVRSH